LFNIYTCKKNPQSQMLLNDLKVRLLYLELFIVCSVITSNFEHKLDKQYSYFIMFAVLHYKFIGMLYN